MIRFVAAEQGHEIVAETQGYGVYLDNGATSFFNLDPEYKGELTFGALAGELDYYVLPGPAPQEA